MSNSDFCCSIGHAISNQQTNNPGHRYQIPATTFRGIQSLSTDRISTGAEVPAVMLSTKMSKVVNSLPAKSSRWYASREKCSRESSCYPAFSVPDSEKRE